ncbi:MAG: OsmC family protein [Actinomycetota bacterium]|nr:OsmC family protein [Actinomycetota bacterium]
MNKPKFKVRGKRFIYRTSIEMTGKGKGIIDSADKPSIELSTPVESGGILSTWTPEELMLTSVNACLMTTFSYYASKKGLEALSYESFSEGVIELVETRYQFSRITLKPKLKIKSIEDIDKANNLLEISKEGCFVSNSLNSEIILEPEIEAAS